MYLCRNREKTSDEMSVKGKYLNPKADLTFKLIFGEHADLMKSFLNALLPLEAGREIESVVYANPELIPENPGKKNSIVDVRCTDNQGREFIVEMQLHWNDSFKQRVMLNASKAVVKQAGTGEDYSLIQPVYSLNLVNQGLNLGDDVAPDEYYHHYAVVNVEHTDRVLEGFHFVFIDLEKFTPKTISLADISKATGLTTDEIADLVVVVVESVEGISVVRHHVEQGISLVIRQ